MNKPNIVLIVMDAVRTQNMSVYEYEKETTPSLERILPNCLLYKNAISSSYWTLPSYASTFTGTHVSTHGLAVNGDVLSEDFMTMAEMLHALGYKTVGLCPNPFVSSFSGLHRGFDIFCNPADSSLRFRLYNSFNKAIIHLQRKKDETVAKKDFGGRWLFHDTELRAFRKSSIYKRALWSFKGLFDKYAKTTNNLAFKLMEKVQGDPFFLFIHYHETHSPYVLPSSYSKRFLGSLSEKKPWDVNQDYFKYYSGEVSMGKADFSILRAFYDGAISYLDTRIFEVYSFLQEKELLDNTLMVITSDHGDSFGENGIFFHNFGLYDSLIKIPLIIKYPHNMRISGIENRIVQNTDLLPTIMDLLEVSNKKLLNQIQGNSLISSNINNRDHSYAISELVKPFGPRMRSIEDKLERYNRELISIRTKRNKYIHASDGNHEFYDLQNDPYETNNLIELQTPDITELRGKLKPWLAPFHDCSDRIKRKIEQEDEETELDADIQQRLENLGYL